VLKIPLLHVLGDQGTAMISPDFNAKQFIEDIEAIPVDT
jgi:hypothetical protein